MDRAPLALIAVAAGVALAACTATPADPITTPGATPGATASSAPTPPPSTAASSLADLPEPVPTGRVIAAGLALDDGGAVLCVGDVGATLPPTCRGIPMTGFDWDAAPTESAGGARWAHAVVQGTYDGEAFVVTEAPQPFDAWSPPAVEVPPGDASDARLATIQAEVMALERDDILGSGPATGWLGVQVVYDDGSMQAFLDDRYGEGTVHVFSALQG